MNIRFLTFIGTQCLHTVQDWKNRQDTATHPKKLQIRKKLTVLCYVQTTTLPHQITARGQSKHRDVLYQLHQTAQLHSETSQVAWSTDHRHHVQYNQVELQSALQPAVNNLAVTH